MPPEHSEVVVGLDVGTTGVKGIAVAPDGTVAAVAEHGYPLSTPQAGWSEQDPEDWWRATEVVLGALGAELGGARIAGIGLTGQMHGLVALDSADSVIRPAILWNDQRTGAECAEIEELIGLDRLISLTGNRALTGFTAPKLLWLRRHEPDSYHRIARIMLPKDYVRLRLTGEWATDVADASGTLLLDVADRTWSDDVLDALELPAAWMPPVLESPEVSGVTLASDNVSQGIPVAAGAGDCAAAAIGVGIDRPGPLSIVMGTSGVVFAALPAFASDPQARVHAFCHAVPGPVARDGRDALRRRVAAVVPRPARAGHVLRRPRRRGRGLGAGRRRAPLCALPRRRAARRTPIPPRGPRSPASSSATTAAPSSAPCSRASRSGCATRSSSCRASAVPSTVPAPPVAARAASGSRSWRRCSACRSS